MGIMPLYMPQVQQIQPLEDNDSVSQKGEELQGLMELIRGVQHLLTDSESVCQQKALLVRGHYEMGLLLRHDEE